MILRLSKDVVEQFLPYKHVNMYKITVLFVAYDSLLVIMYFFEVLFITLMILNEKAHN